MPYIGINIHYFSIGVIDGYNGMPYENPYNDEEDYDAYEDGWEFGAERAKEDYKANEEGS
tara:strand:- start:50 stop:229 length:180 start_codon:yes stop_codon:yes gene_type:complete